MHSGVLNTLTRVQSDLSEAWPGRATVALVTASPISERLYSALSSTGIVCLKLARVDDVESVIADLLRTMGTSTGAQSEHVASDIEPSLMNRVATAMESENWEQARLLYADILEEQIKTLGPAHPSVIETRNRLAYLLMRSGRPAEALEAYKELLNHQVNTLGPDHPTTLAIRSNMAISQAQSGDVESAVRAYRDILNDEERILGPDHPTTLATRFNLAIAEASKVTCSLPWPATDRSSPIKQEFWVQITCVR